MLLHYQMITNNRNISNTGTDDNSDDDDETPLVSPCQVPELSSPLSSVLT